jgi:hypothetical protein
MSSIRTRNNDGVYSHSIMLAEQSEQADILGPDAGLRDSQVATQRHTHDGVSKQRERTTPICSRQQQKGRPPRGHINWDTAAVNNAQICPILFDPQEPTAPRPEAADVESSARPLCLVDCGMSAWPAAEMGPDARGNGL